MTQELARGVNGLPALPDSRRTVLEALPGGHWDRLLRLAAAALDAPAALLAVLRDGREVWKGSVGLPAALAVPPDVPAESSFVGLLAADGEPLALDDLPGDARLVRSPLVTEAGARALLGVPLTNPFAQCPACLAVVDFKARAWSARDVAVLRDLGHAVLAELDLARLREEARVRREEAQRERKDKQAVLAGLPHGLFMLDLEGRLTLLNPEAIRFFQKVAARPPEELLGKNLWVECPEVADSTFARECRQAEAEHRDFHLETFFPGLRRWFAFHGIRSADGLCVSIEDVTDRTKLEKSLRARAEQLAESDRGKEVFLLQLAHELRNALAPIRNALHLWASGGVAAADGDHARGMAEREVQRISRLLDDVLKVSQLRPGNLSPRLEPLDLAEVVTAALQATLAAPELRGRRLSVHLPPDPLPVEGDRQMLEQVLVHLLQNAARFTKPGGVIDLDARRDGDAVCVRVRDNGVGIDPETLPHVFDLFMRAGRAEGRLQAGLGIGLTLVRRFVEAHGGEVEAHSDGPDRGTEVVIRLPAPADGEPPADAGPADGRRPGRVLVVDNSTEAAQSIAMLLKVWGYEVRVAYDPLAALQEARAHPPGVVLLDIGMPGMDGYEVARRLRRQDESKGAVLVAVTGYGEDEDRRRAQEAGFDYHMVKPVDPNDLRELLETAGFHGRAGARRA